jgi:hypothetical protein
MTEQAQIPPAPEEDTRAAHAIPSTLANRFHLTAGDMLMRVSFGEQVSPDTPTTYHQAVTLPRNEAVLLARMILEMYQAEPPAPKAH